MKNLIVFVLMAVSILSCRKDPKIESCLVCQSQIDYYSTDYFLDDAELLAYELISLDSTHVGYNQITIDETTVQNILGKLSAIYNAAFESTNSMNEMLTYWNVHVGHYYLLNQFSVKFSDTLGLMQEILNNPGNTSNPFINELYHDYGFKSIKQSWSNDVLYFYSLKNYNVRKIKEQLLTSTDILGVNFNYYFLDGDDIEHAAFEGYDEFIFSFGWGDCPSGCMSKHFWKIKVDDNCEVTLVEEYGDELPG